MKRQKSQSKNKDYSIEDFNILYDNVLVRAIEIEEVGGMVRPQQYDDKPEIAEVIKVGEGRIFDNGTIIPLKVKPGQVVFFNKYSVTKFNSDGNDYYIVREEDIIAYK